MKPMVPVLLIAVASVAGCGKESESAAGSKGREPGGAGNPLTAPVDYLGAVGAAQRHAEKVADLVPLQHAVQAFQAGEDRLPSNLRELVTEGYLPKLPDAPRGTRIEYNPQTGQVRIVAAPRPPAGPPTPPTPGDRR